MEISDERASVTATLERPSRVDRGAVVVAAAPLAGSATLTILGLMWVVAMIGVGAVGIHDGLVEAGIGTPWIDDAVDRVDGLRPAGNVLIAAGVGGLVGLVLVVLALWPRRRRKIGLRTRAGVYLRKRHLERQLAGWMESRDGVVRCWVKDRGRTVCLEVRSVDGVDPVELYGGVISTARDEIGVLLRRPDLQIRVREVG